MSGSPFTLVGAIVLLVIGLLGIVFCLVLVARHKLTMSYAVVWVLLLVGMELLVGFPPLLRLAMMVLGTAETQGALRLLALVTIVGFLIFFSVKISVLTNKFEDLVQRMALADYDARKNQASSRGEAGAEASVPEPRAPEPSTGSGKSL